MLDESGWLWECKRQRSVFFFVAIIMSAVGCRVEISELNLDLQGRTLSLGFCCLRATADWKKRY